MKFCILALACLALVSYSYGADQCITDVDVLLVVEDSDHLPAENADDLRDFVEDIVKYFVLGPASAGEPQAQVAYQQYNTANKNIFYLNQYTTTADAQAAVHSTPFLRPVSDPNAPIAPALDYTWATMLNVTNGERSCSPTTVVLISYSKASDINGLNDAATDAADLTSSRILKHSGAQIITVGVGPDRNPKLLEEIATSQDTWYDFATYDLLTEDVAVAIAKQACAYVPHTEYYPNEVEVLIADVVFVVGVSDNFAAPLATSVNTFISKFLAPYSYGPTGVQAALVTFAKIAEVNIPFNGTGSANSYTTFTTMTNTVLQAPDLPKGGSDIFKALDQVLHHVLIPAAGFRPTAAHQIYILTADCFTGDDPTPFANEIKAIPNTQIFIVNIGPPRGPAPTALGASPPSPGLWKEYVDIVGSPQNLIEAQDSPTEILTNYLHHLAWRNMPDNGTLPVGSTTAAPPTTVTSTTTTLAPPAHNSRPTRANRV